MTSTRARIHGWGVHAYSNVPGWSKVYEKAWPVDRKPESNDPSAAVTVWIWPGSLLVQVTVAPSGTISTLAASSAGASVSAKSSAASAAWKVNAPFTMSTWKPVPDGAGVPLATGEPLAAGVVLAT